MMMIGSTGKTMTDDDGATMVDEGSCSGIRPRSRSCPASRSPIQS